MPRRTAEVYLEGKILATYVFGWRESDEPPSDERMKYEALKSAWDEGLLPEEDAQRAVVLLGAPPTAL